MLKKILEGDVPTSNQLGFYHRIVFVFVGDFMVVIVGLVIVETSL